MNSWLFYARALCLVVAISAGHAAAQPLRIAYVNSVRVMSESAPAKAAEAKLQVEFSGRKIALEKLADGVQAARDALQKDEPLLSEPDLAIRRRQLFERERELLRQRHQLDEDFTRRRDEELTAILELANRVMQVIAKDDRLDLVLENVVYATPRVDITDKVIKALEPRAGN